MIHALTDTPPHRHIPLRAGVGAATTNTTTTLPGCFGINRY
jgi:hypothetical protein